MRIPIRSAVVVLAACLLPALSCHKNEEYSQHFNKASDETFHRDMSDLSSFKLSNGATVYLQEERTDHQVAVCAVYRAGYSRDPKGQVQLAHLVEHMLMRCASGPYKTGETMSVVKDHKGMISAEAVADFIHVDYVVDADRLDETLAIEASRLKELSCDEETLKAQAKDVVDEFGRTLAAPRANLGRLSLGALSHIIYYGDTFIPMEASLSKYTLEDVRKFHDTYYRPDDMILVLIGNFKKADAEALVRKHFEAIPSRPAPPEPVITLKHSVRATWDVPAHVEYFVAPGPFTDPTDRLILTMFGSFVQQLFQNSADVYSNCQAVYTSNQSYPVGRLPFFVFVQASEGFTTDKVVPSLFGRYDQAVKALEDDRQVELIKTGMVSFLTSSGLKPDQPDYPMLHFQVIGQEALMVALKSMLLNGKTLDEFTAEIEAITPDQFRATVAKVDRDKLLTITIDPRS